MSDAIELVYAPFRTSAALSEAISREGRSAVARRVVFGTLRNLFVMAAFVVLTSAGRLTLLDALHAMLSFVWVPVVQALALSVARRCVKTEASFLSLFAVHLEGHAPWSLAFTLLGGLTVFVSSPDFVLPKVAPVVMLAAFGTSVLLTFASFRAGTKVGRRRALLATLAYYGTATVIVLAYFSALGQLGPILPTRGGAP